MRGSAQSHAEVRVLQQFNDRPSQSIHIARGNESPDLISCEHLRHLARGQAHHSACGGHGFEADIGKIFHETREYADIGGSKHVHESAGWQYAGNLDATLLAPQAAEITELCFGLALAVFAVDFAVGARWLALGRARLAFGVNVGAIAVALTLTALMVAAFGYPRHVLKLRLTDFAAERLPALGLNAQAAVIFDYLDDHPELRTDETDLRQARWLVDQRRASDAGPILERVLARARAAQRANGDDPDPWHDEARVHACWASTTQRAALCFGLGRSTNRVCHPRCPDR